MAAMEESACLCCGGTAFEEDSAHGVVACMTCGTALERQLLTQGQEPPHVPASGARCSLPSKQQICMFSDKRYIAKKLANVVKQTVKMSETMKLPKTKADICVEQAKELSRRRVIGRRGLRIEYVSAALVYIAWKNENACVSARDMVNTGLKPSVIVRVAKRLCNEHPDLLSISQSEPPSDEERLTLRLDRFSTIERCERKKVLEVAIEIWSMVLNVRVQTIHIKLPINDYTILAVALQYIRRKGLTKTELEMLAVSVSMTTQSVQTRIWVVRKALLTLASRCPCLEEDVKNCVITTKNVTRYLDRLIRNKKYLINEVELMNKEEEEEEKESEETEDSKSSPKKKRTRVQSKKRKVARVHPTSVPVVLANEEAPSLGGEEEEEEDIDLSDLDDDELEEYIFTQEEVTIRKNLLFSENEPHEH